MCAHTLTHDTCRSKVNSQKLHELVGNIFFFSFLRRIPVTLVGERKKIKKTRHLEGKEELNLLLAVGEMTLYVKYPNQYTKMGPKV